MLTGEIRNKIDKIWTDIWAGGITNPLTVIEQLTYLMFIRSLLSRGKRRGDFRAIQKCSKRPHPRQNFDPITTSLLTVACPAPAQRHAP